MYKKIKNEIKWKNKKKRNKWEKETFVGKKMNTRKRGKIKIRK